MTTLSDLLLALINFFTSTFTAITGVGGGLILIAIMPWLIEPQALIPMHAATQLFSNASRSYFGRPYILWQHVLPFLLGSIIGAIIFGILVRHINLNILPPLIGSYILLILWSKRFNHLIRKLHHFAIIGFIQTGLGIFVGAPGPLATAVLHKKTENHQQVVATAATMMSIVHSLKILTYILFIGFHLGKYWRLLTMMIIAAILGSYIGARFQTRINQQRLKTILQWILTLLALKLILGYLLF